MNVQSIRARVGDKVIKNADKFYRGSTADTLDELVQNARRAGATHVRFELGDAAPGGARTLVVSDDGRGLPSDGAEVLLTFGGSANDAETEAREDAAGMGFFSLAQHDVVVRSRDWSMAVPSGAFTGRGEATLTTGLPDVGGLRVEIAGIERTQGFEALAGGGLVRTSTRHSGLRATLVGFGAADGTHEPQGFLDADPARLVCSVSGERHGVAVRVDRVAVRDKDSLRVNFFGKVITPDRDKTPVGLPRVERRGVSRWDAAAGTIVRSHESIVVRVDVRRVGTLRMRLPDRNEVHADDGARLVGAFVEELVVRALRGEGRVVDAAAAARNGVGFGARIRDAATALDLPIPAPSIDVSVVDDAVRDDDAWDWRDGVRRGASEPGGVRLPDGSLVPLAACVATHDEGYLRALLGLAIGGATEAGGATLFDEDDLRAAYGTDGAGHARLTRVEVVARVGDDEHEASVDAQEELQTGLDDAIAEGIQVGPLVDGLGLRLVSVGPDGTEASRTLPMSAVPHCQSGDETYDVGVLVTPGARASHVVAAMVDGFDWVSDDPSSDSRESQRDYVEELYGRVVAKALGQAEGLFRDTVAEAVRRGVRDLLPAVQGDEDEVTEVVVRVRRGPGGTSVEVVCGAPAPAPVAEAA